MWPIDYKWQRCQTSILHPTKRHFITVNNDKLSLKVIVGVANLVAGTVIIFAFLICRERTVDLDLTLENVNKPKMLWSGSCSRKLGLIEPAGSTEVELEVVARDTALQLLSGVRITDSLLMRSYQFDELCHIYVTKDENLLCL